MNPLRQARRSARLKRRLGAGIGRLRANGWPILQTATAASLAYFLATSVLGNEQAFFAPIAAVVTLGLALGQRGRRAVEVAIGVALGLAIADLIVLLIGVGSAQIGVVVALAMAAAVLFGDRTLFVNQAAISAILVVVLQPPQEVFTPDRLLNALVGGGVALAIHHLFPVNPERVVERAAKPIFEELASVLEEIGAVIEKDDLERAEAVLLRARELDERVRGFYETLSAGHETARLSPTGRRSIKHLQLYSGASLRMEFAAINTRVLARGTYNAIRQGDQIPLALPEAFSELSRAVRYLASYLEEAEGPEEARHHALGAARLATEVLKKRHDLATSVLVSQVRTMTFDLLRSTGMNQAQAFRSLEDAAGNASNIE